MYEWKAVAVGLALVGLAGIGIATRFFPRIKRDEKAEKIFGIEPKNDDDDKMKRKSKKTLAPQSRDVVNAVLFFPDFEDTSTRELISYFANAKFSIQLCLFRFSYRPLGNVILKKFKEGLIVGLIVDYDVYKDFGSGNGLIFRLHRSGIPVKLRKSYGHMHHKFAIIDEKIILSGSLNWTEQGISQNDEDVIVSVQEDHAERYMTRYIDLWKGAEDP